MTAKRRLLKKIEASLRVTGVPRYIQRQGHMWYTTAELVLGLAVREAYRLSYRRAARFLDEEYLERNIVEEVFKRLKSLFGGHILGRNARTVRAELFMRLILYNLFQQIKLLLSTDPRVGKYL